MSEACQVSTRTVQRIVREGKDNVESAGSKSFGSPRKRINRQNVRNLMDGLNKDVIRRTLLGYYARGEYPTLNKLLRDLKNDGRRFLMERADTVTARVIFLRKMHLLRKKVPLPHIFYLDETYIHQNYASTKIWQDKESTGGLKVPVGKGGRIIVCHVDSSQTGFLQECKLVFRPKSKSTSDDYHTDMNAVVFK